MNKIMRFMRRNMLYAEPFPLFNLHLFQHSTNIINKEIAIAKCAKLINPFHCCATIVRALHWYGYRLWKTMFILLRAQKKNVDIPLVQQIFGLLHISLYHIPLNRYYRYELYKKEHQILKTQLIYTNALPEFHHLINKTHDLTQCKKLFVDKETFAQELHRLHIPTIPTLCISDSEIIHTHKQDLFCKPVIGSQSQDAFCLKYTANQHILIPIHGQKITDPHLVTKFVQQKFAQQRFLIQPCIQDHPVVEKFKESEEITTMRIITVEFADKHIEAIYLQLEIPIAAKKQSRQYYKIYPLDCKSYDIDCVWKKNTQVNYDMQITIPQLLKQMIQEAVQHCATAHKALFDVKSIAFDVAFGKEGVVIIEANYNWDIEMLYRTVSLPLQSDKTGLAANWLREIFFRTKGCC